MGTEDDEELRMRDTSMAAWAGGPAHPRATVSAAVGARLPGAPSRAAAPADADERAAARAAILARYVGASPAAQRVRDSLARVARVDAPVLVLGPTGTGKELAARIVHELSSRAAGPFVAVDCGALSEGVLESELFGHARGAFSGAISERRGLFEEAHGGTLFLDEITNTSLQLQARLLRVLQQREIRRVGCNRTRPVDVRVVAAANRELSAEVAAGRFREDLLYRLDVLTVRLPALADRSEDVPELVSVVLEELSGRDEVWYDCSGEALALLARWAWPGNVRELRNVLERASAFAPRGRIGLEQLPERITGRRSELAPARGPLPLRDLLMDYERVLLRERLEANSWNRTLTARQLGITRRCLFDKIRQHGLEPPA